jgi:hypothetical protein
MVGLKTRILPQPYTSKRPALPVGHNVVAAGAPVRQRADNVVLTASSVQEIHLVVWVQWTAQDGKGAITPAAVGGLVGDAPDLIHVVDAGVWALEKEEGLVGVG